MSRWTRTEACWLAEILRLYRDIQVLKTYGAAPYAAALKKLEKEIKDKQTSVNEKIGVKVGGRTTYAESRSNHRLGVRHRSCTTTSLGHRRRQTTNAGRAAFTSRTMYQDHSRRERFGQEQVRYQRQADSQVRRQPWRACLAYRH